MQKHNPLFALLAAAGAGLLLLVAGAAAGSVWLTLSGLVTLAAAAAWGARGWRLRPAGPGQPAAAKGAGSGPQAGAGAGSSAPHAALAHPDDLVQQMLAQQRYALLLRPQIAANLAPAQLEAANEQMQEQMALVPEGEVFLCQPEEQEVDDKPIHGGGRIVRIEAALLDRYPVTNAQFKRFVDAGGYEQMALWAPEIWQGVFEFVDSTGMPGPKFWKDGTYPRGEEDHPVVGVSWYEACAYARWVGKRLPTDAEWVKAGCWPMPVARGLPVQRKYPWGDAWEPTRANIWGCGPGHTTPVTDYEDGASVAGVYGLSGNVWEWTTDPYGLWHSWMSIEGPNGALRSLRGGAFDTYFESQATCQFQSGDSPLARKHNIGFRCALGLCDLRPLSGGADLDASDAGEGSPAGSEHELVCEEAP